MESRLETSSVFYSLLRDTDDVNVPFKSFSQVSEALERIRTVWESKFDNMYSSVMNSHFPMIMSILSPSPNFQQFQVK